MTQAESSLVVLSWVRLRGIEYAAWPEWDAGLEACEKSHGVRRMGIVAWV